MQQEQTVALEGAVAAEAAPPATGRKRRKNRLKRQQNIWGWIFVSLLVLGTTFFTYIALIITLILSFSNYQGGNLFEYLGDLTYRNGDALYWYKYMFQATVQGDPNAGDALNVWSTFGNSVFYLIGIPIGLVLSMFFAVCMSRDIKFSNAFRVIYYIPTVASIVSISLIWNRLFNEDGAINNMLGTEVQWLTGDQWIRKVTILILTVWKGLGGSIILFVAGLSGVNLSYKEAAEIDGANAWQIFWKITMPQLYPTIFYVLVTSVIGGMQIYTEPNLIYGDFGDVGVGTPVTPFVGYVMYVVNTQYWYGYGCALSVILAIVIFLLTLVQFALNGRRDKA